MDVSMYFSHRSGEYSSASDFDAIAAGAQFPRKGFTVFTLDFNDPVFDGAAGTTFLFESLGERF